MGSRLVVTEHNCGRWRALDGNSCFLTVVRWLGTTGEWLSTVKVLAKSTLSKQFIKALHPSTLSGITKTLRHVRKQTRWHTQFIKALLESTLSQHFAQALCTATLSNHFIRVFIKHFRNTRQGNTKVLKQGNASK